MGGRGASSGYSINGHKYGEEFTTVHQSGNIKFITYNLSKSAKTPIETMTEGRVYAIVNNIGNVKAVTYYDKNKKKYKHVDINGRTHIINGKATIPHTHVGYLHDEKGTRNLNPKEKKMVERVLKIWYNLHNK